MYIYIYIFIAYISNSLNHVRYAMNFQNRLGLTSFSFWWLGVEGEWGRY